MPVRATPSDELAIEILEASVPADWIRAGYATTVRVTVYNPRERSELNLRVTHDGAYVSMHTVEVESGETATLELSVTFTKAAVGTVGVNGFSAGNLTVAEPDDQGPVLPAEPEAQSGFAVLAALVAGLLGTLWARLSMSTREEGEETN
jgi:hypothetical protein